MNMNKKTKYEYEIQGNYGYGWEMICSEETFDEAINMRKCYDENEPNILHRVVRRRANDRKYD